MTVSRDTYIARMLSLIGWQQWASASETRYPTFRWHADLLNEIDEILLSSEPYRFTESHVDALEQQTGKPVRRGFGAKKAAAKKVAVKKEAAPKKTAAKKTPAKKAAKKATKKTATKKAATKKVAKKSVAKAAAGDDAPF